MSLYELTQWTLLSGLVTNLIQLTTYVLALRMAFSAPRIEDLCRNQPTKEVHGDQP